MASTASVHKVQLEPTQEQINQLVQDLKSPDIGVRSNAIFLLGVMGEFAASAVGTLTEALKDKKRYVRCSAIEVLGYIGPAAAPAVPAITEFLQESNRLIIETALHALGLIGSPVGVDVLQLVELIKHNHRDIRLLAAFALREIAISVERDAPKMDVSELTHTFSLWKNVQTRIDTMGGIETRLPVNYEKAQTAVHRLIEALQREQRSR